MAKLTTMEKPVWLKYTQEEVKEIISKLAEKGLTAEKIGLILRDQYGIPKVKIYGFKVSNVLKEKNKFEEPTLINLIKKVNNLEAHYSKNKQDKVSDRALIINKANLKKTKDYQQKKRENAKRN